MRRAGLALIALLAGAPVHARPVAGGRIAMIARGDLAPAALGTSGGDDRAAVTVRAIGGTDALRRAGFDAHALAGDIAALRVTADELRRLLALPFVINVEERRRLRPQLDASGPAVGAPAARAETGLDGSGVLVAVIDTGLDYRHADFRHPDGSTRVAALLDLAHTRGQLHPELPDYAGGALWLRADIDAVLAAEAAGTTPTAPVGERDTDGHGSHVTGIAAANGLATGAGFPAGRYVGMAPGADLVIAQATHGGSGFTDDDVVTSCRFAVDQSQALQRPMVLNLSLGGPGGPHDGSTNLEQALDALFPADAPGRAIVIAAGNDGSIDQHAGAWALDGSAHAPIQIPASPQPDGQLALDVWYTGTLSLSVTSPAGMSYGNVSLGHSYKGPITREGQVLIDNGASQPVQANGRQGASVVITGPSGAPPQNGVWTVVLDGRARRWDIWVSDEPLSSSAAHFVDGVAEDDRLAMPAAAHNAITVGSFVTKNQWTTFHGKAITRSSVLGSPSTFTAGGPTADDRFAPDLLAPGEYIAASLSRDAPPDSPSSEFYVGESNDMTWADDGLHGILRGTSQAAPHVTGAIALLLQAQPTLTATQLREILRATAHDDLGGYTPRSGFGKLDVLSALRYLRGTRGATVDAKTSSVGLSRDLLPPGDDTTVVTVTPRDTTGAPLGPGHQVSITASAGTPVGDVVDTGFGRYERTFAAHAALGTTAIVSASVDGVRLAATRPLFFVAARANVGDPFVAGGGGCSLSRRAAAPTGVTLLIFLICAWRTAKSRRPANPRTLDP